jgi:hypothetical protein
VSFRWRIVDDQYFPDGHFPALFLFPDNGAGELSALDSWGLVPTTTIPRRLPAGTWPAPHCIMRLPG